MRGIDDYGFQFPLKNMTDEHWQKIFAELKRSVPYSGRRTMPSTIGRPRSKTLCVTDNIMDRYSVFINEALKAVRNSEVDYCYYIYQVIDLLRYEPELLSEYLPEHGCIKVFKNTTTEDRGA